jgi:L-threonylcarbamoyladenylate synthase
MTSDADATDPSDAAAPAAPAAPAVPATATGPVTVDATVDDPGEAIATAVAALREGRLAVVPTDTVYGVVADAFSTTATRRVFGAKRRSRRFPLAVLVRSPKQLPGLVTLVPEAAERLMAAYWPGPLTIVVPRDPNLLWDLGDDEGVVAVRMPLDDVALAVVRAVGPLACTSANLSGQAPATTVDNARQQLGDQVGVYVDGGRRGGGRPSTIVDLTRAEPAILRSGALDDDEVLTVARGELDPLGVATGRVFTTAGAGADDGADDGADEATGPPADDQEGDRP